MPRRILFHPFLFALFSILSYWVTNKNFVFLSDIWRTVIVGLVGVGFIYLIIWFISRNSEKTALLSSIITIFFLYSGHLYFSFTRLLPSSAQNTIFSVVWSSLFITSSYVVIRFCKQCDQLNTYLNSVSLFLIIFPLWQVALIFFTHDRLMQPQVGNITGNNLNEANNLSQNQPDIYYFILDGYGRGDVLKQLYSFDNTGFLDSLAKRGFYIANQSTANYIQTTLSLSSSLTGDYLDSAQFDPLSNDRTITPSYLNESPLLQQFHQLGYQIVALKDDYSLVRLNAADETIPYESSLNSFELGFYDLTLGHLFFPSLYEYTHWQIVRSQLDLLEKIPAKSDKPRFVFAHLLIPHPAFIFDKNGNFISQNTGLTDGNHYPGTIDQYILGYTGQLEYLNSRIIRIVDHLLANKNRSVVIILQGDHGPGGRLDWESLEKTCLKERLSIFNAYYFSNKEAREKLYPTVSPVNSFRIVFDQLLNQPMPLLEDRSYYSTWSRPYDFIDVTNSKNSCLPLK